ncbi:MAG: 4Fe-4S binding protein [Malacoplasma sp.]
MNKTKYQAVVEENKCESCQLCITVCPTDSITIINGKASIDDSCIACGACVAVCPNEAIEIKLMEVSEIIKKK